MIRLLRLAHSRRALLVTACGLSGISALLSLVPAIVIYRVAAELLHPVPDSDAIASLAIVAACGMGLRWLLMAAAFGYSHVAAYGLLYDLRLAVLRKLTRVPLGFVTRHQTGAVKKILQEDVERIELFVAHILVDAAAAIITPVATVVILAFIDWRMALATVALLPIAALIQFAMYRDANTIMARYVRASESMNGALVEYIRAMPVIRVFNTGQSATAKLKQSVETYRDLVTAVAHRIMPYWAAFNVTIRAGVLTIMPLGVLLVLHGSLSLPVFLLFLLIGIGIVQPALRLIFASSLLRTIEHGADRLFDLLDAPDLPSPVNGRVPERASVVFEDVRFGYGNGPVLDGISFRLEAGTVTAIVGPSGAGKSTIVQLLARFWDPDTGAVRIGDIDLREMSSTTLNDWVSFVFQDVFLFDDTVLENIRLGRADASDDEVKTAAKAAGIDEFIGTLPQGYGTMIGDRGARLSGGQRQRLSIARALLRNTPIIILDEITAFADAETEARIADGLRLLTRGKTVLAVTHRLSTVARADRVLVLERGRVVAQGVHRDLAVENEVYQSLFSPDRDVAAATAPLG